ncbi:ATP-binding cassette domain-containing protein [Nonomuraea phyllanthi]|uniref:ATP-binding cassette domain-containing protein n=1 Tax=Nonomuraea phyllanthi TaxID=2219224 RepID=A0A5C4WLR4_9ACTN|nr:ATP-binding cassette domain-containing protein [Nonomuraea phyllanthi]KAB8194489.1 ATP-binding cassette domain-containing protein [Nonomuraea phyllanthi]QFY08917.1 ATP-binding cassette domain-containing protein [Nonomuraea phyllanthi]
MTALEFQGVRVRLGRRRHAADVVKGVDLTVPAGTVVGLVGESGCGKSTLARAAVGLVPLAAGRITPGSGVQLVFQDPYSSLDPRMTVGSAVAEAVPKGAGVDRAGEVARLLDLVGLEPGHAGRLPRHLSGGQRQRVAIARALAARPRVVIADEITSALDVSVQGMVLNLVRELQRELGLTMLFISHNLAVVRYVSDRVAVMNRGRIVESGPVDDVLSAPRDPYTRTLLESVPRLR